MANNIRFASLTQEQQRFFNGLNERQQRYVVFRSKGYNRAEAYRLAGYNSGDKSPQNAYIMETRSVPRMPEIIQALAVMSDKQQMTQEDTEKAKEIDRKAKQAMQEFKDACSVVPMESTELEQAVDINKLSSNDAENIQFYRNIVTGVLKNKKKTIRKDADGNIIETKVEEYTDVEQQIKARKELNRLLGVKDAIDIGKVNAGSINILIVDASRPKEEVDERDKVVITQEVEEVKENAEEVHSQN